MTQPDIKTQTENQKKRIQLLVDTLTAKDPKNILLSHLPEPLSDTSKDRLITLCLGKSNVVIDDETYLSALTIYEEKITDTIAYITKHEPKPISTT